ncbi:hypothetical protein I305_04484 [Cryptococcus gattii E566]|nr:hypothetical protein I305_04484 [Cryptococcus gattii E566]KJE02832.1 hypothetical protein I311_03333 [Cryptococcus gattii NT-10]
MKALHSKTILSQRSTVPKARPVAQRIRKLYTTGLPKRLLRGKQEKAQEQIQINDGLAICLFGFSTQAQKQQIKVSEQVSTQPSSKKQLNMWRKWEKTEAPLRQGRGWYPRLDRHFLELLVISEIHCLSYPLDRNNGPLGYAERVHRHAIRVRRVACERIGAERLHAYCERVKEAFEAYMMGGWATVQVHAEAQMRSQMEMNHFEDAEDQKIDESRGRKLERGNGSMIREVISVQKPSPENPSAFTDPSAGYEGEEDQSHLLEIDMKVVQLDGLSEEVSEEDLDHSASIKAL